MQGNMRLSLYDNENIRIENIDCVVGLKKLEENSIDAIITDPPYEIGFMEAGWDKSGIAYDVEMWRECLRVLKPGGHLLSFAGARTYHRIACAIEDAGFEIRDCWEWIYASGFPKGENIAKSIDKKNGLLGQQGKRFNVASKYEKGLNERNRSLDCEHYAYEPKCEESKKWNGWNTNLKPAHEPIAVARKPFAEKNAVENILKWGCGALNIDAGRIPATRDGGAKPRIGNNGLWALREKEIANGVKTHNSYTKYGYSFYPSASGRFPPNVIFDEPAAKMLDAQSGESRSDGRLRLHLRGHKNCYNKFPGSTLRYGLGDSGGASRFFYVAKASPSERDADGNNHTTVKPLKLMEYLVKLVTPKDGTVLDPFAGSGTTLVAARNLGLGAVGFEISADYVKIIERRLA